MSSAPPGPAPGDGTGRPAEPDPSVESTPASVLQLFLVFSGLALRGFGGVMPWAQRVLVEERRWLRRERFVEVLAFAQLLPGPNICNLAIMMGDRWFGWRGALAALGGLLVAPAVMVLAAAVLVGQVADEPITRRVLAGMGAAAGGMLLATAIKLAGAHRGRWGWLGFGLLSFAGIALLRWPLVQVLALLAPVAVAAAWFVQRREGAGRADDRADGGGR
jgi:chromate transporter